MRTTTPMIALDSSLLAGMRYSPQATRDLAFRHGATYRYFTVPRTVADRLATAGSKGAYFNRCIKDRFPYRRLA